MVTREYIPSFHGLKTYSSEWKAYLHLDRSVLLVMANALGSLADRTEPVIEVQSGEV